MRIMRQYLHLFPYKIQILQFQTNASKAERHAYGQTISQRIKDRPAFFDVISFTTRQIHTLVVTWTKRICACRLKRSLMSISIAHLVCSK